MNKFIKIAIVVLVVIGGIALAVKFGNKPITDTKPLGGSGELSIPITASDFSTRASVSSQGLVKNTPGRVFSIEVTSVASAVKYFQIFDMTLPVVPARSASQSSPYNTWAYTSSNSIQYKPVGSNVHYASQSIVYSVPIPGTTASSSPTVTRISSDFFAPARKFNKGIIWAISSQFATFSSASVEAVRHTVRVVYE